MTALPAQLPVDDTLVSIDRLVLRARTGAVSFAAPATAEDAEFGELLAEVEAESSQDRPRWRAAHDELTAFLAQLDDDIRHLAVVRTGDGVGTWVSWGGDAVTVVAGAGDRTAARHLATLSRRVRVRYLRLQLFTIVVPAAARIAALLTTPGAAVLALPIAWRLSRSVLANLQAQLDLELPGVLHGQ